MNSVILAIVVHNVSVREFAHIDVSVGGVHASYIAARTCACIDWLARSQSRIRIAAVRIASSMTSN